MDKLILLHGALGSEQDLLFLKDHFPQDLQVHFFTFQGHAGNPISEEFSIKAFAHELSSFITDHKIERPLVFGYSMGGYVALKLALTEPGLLGGIITLGTKFDWNPEFTTREISRLDPIIMEEKIPAFVQQLKKQHGQDWRTLLERTSKLMSSLIDTRDVFMAELTSLELPVWIGRGDRDRMVSLEESVRTWQSIKNSGLFVLPDSGHTLDQVDVPVLVQHIISFLKRQSGKSD